MNLSPSCGKPAAELAALPIDNEDCHPFAADDSQGRFFYTPEERVEVERWTYVSRDSEESGKIIQRVIEPGPFHS
jgi:hypothetical protein